MQRSKKELKQIFLPPDQKLFFLSIKKANNCLFSRRYGFKGKLVSLFGIKYNICFRLFNKDILTMSETTQHKNK